MDPFVKKIQNFIFHEKLFETGDGIVVGISGGPDSVCLVRVLNELKKKYKLKLSLLHVNYGLRGNDSDADEKFVRELADELDLSLKVVKYKKEKRGNLEEVLREFRYKEFERQRKSLGYEWIAVAHTLDDQVETFLLNLARGAGAVGLSGMLAKNDRILRPILFLEKSEIIEYLARIKQSYRVDKTNINEDFLRNKIRAKVIPFLQRELEKGIKGKIFKATLLLQKGNSYIEHQAKKSYNEIAKVGKGVIVVEVSEFLAVEPHLQGHVFREICLNLKGDLREISEKHFAEFMKIATSAKSKKQEFVFCGIVIERKGNKIKFSKDQFCKANKKH